jgi:HAD superfamily hydrolase (TIGR01509 family)
MTLLFDLDGTITDSNTLWLDIDIEFARKRGLAVTPEYTDFVVHAIFPTAAEFTKDYYHLEESPQQIMDEWFSMAYEAYAHHCSAKPGVVEYLHACHRAGLPLGLVTASVPELCQAAIRRLGIDQLFSFTIYAQELGLEKQEPAFWQEVSRITGEELEHCVVFDDSPVVCQTARQLGCKDVGVYDPLRESSREAMQRECWRYLDGFQGCQLFLQN